MIINLKLYKSESMKNFSKLEHDARKLTTGISSRMNVTSKVIERMIYTN